MKKKILHIQVLPKLSGAQKISLEIFKNLPSEQYEKWVLFSDSLDIGDKQACAAAFQECDVKVIFSSKLKRSIGLSDIGATKEIYRLCKDEKFDIVHTHSTKPGIVGRIAARLAGVPKVIHTVHGLAFHKFIKFPKWQFYWLCEMFAAMFCHRIIIVNKYYLKYFKAFGRKNRVIYNGIDFSTFPQLPKSESEKCRVLFIGRLDEQKDPITILQAAKRVLSSNSEVCFTLVGDGEKMDECKAFIADNNLEQNIELLGWQNNVAQYYANSDIFFAPSIFESFGLMFVEAGYYSLPIVASNVEGIPEVVEDGVTGLLSNPRDIDSLSASLIKLIEDKEYRTEMGQNNYKRVTSLFSSEKMTSQYLEEYRA